MPRYIVASTSKQHSGGLAFYDNQDNYISGINMPFGEIGIEYVCVEIPANASYMRTTYYQDTYDSFNYKGTFRCFTSDCVSAICSLIEKNQNSVSYFSNTHRFTFPTKIIDKAFVWDDNVVNINEEEKTGMGVIRLAYNYRDYGKPTPLILYFHGTGGFDSFNNDEFIDTQLPYIDYLCKCGYNVAAIYAWCNGYDQTNFPTPFSLGNYVKGYEYIKAHYNIEQDGVYVLGRSAGCYSVLSLGYNGGIKIKAAAIHSGATGLIARANSSYQTYLKKFVFDNDVNYEFTAQYLNDNFEKYSSYENILLGVSELDKQKMINATIQRDVSILGTHKRYQPFPSKIWAASDDTSINYQNLVDYAKSVALSGGLCEFRRMPSNYTDDIVTIPNAHHITDTHGPSINSVVTKLGFTVENIPVGYYETIEFFERFG